MGKFLGWDLYLGRSILTDKKVALRGVSSDLGKLITKWLQKQTRFWARDIAQ
jgi:hypothetical protein